MNRESALERARDLGGRGWRTGLSELGGFRKFILRGNVVDLAVGIVIGAAFTSVVNSLVKDVITPLIPGTGTQSLSNMSFKIFTGGTINVGNFINATIAFLIVAAVLYFFVVRPVTALQDRFTPKKEPEAPTTRECPFCLSTVPLKATRCAYCTAQLPPAEEPVSAPVERA
jgi:large conductance mechanosensitive channel